jgi:hypothetical protein
LLRLAVVALEGRKVSVGRKMWRCLLRCGGVRWRAVEWSSL